MTQHEPRHMLEGIEGDDGGINLDAVARVTGLPREEIDVIERRLSDLSMSERHRQIFYGLACRLAREGAEFASAEDVYSAIRTAFENELTCMICGDLDREDATTLTAARPKMSVRVTRVTRTIRRSHAAT
jgi:hypothetical protein